MANVGPVILNIQLLAGNRAQVRVRYTVSFDSYDRNSNQPYREVCRIFGDDTNVGDYLAGGDDSIPNGVLLATTTRSNGNNSISRDLSRVYSRDDLDEDSWPNNPDDIRARTSLTVIAPASRSRASNLVQMNF